MKVKVIDKKSRLGFYFERCVAVELLKKLNKKKLIKKHIKEKNHYRNTKLKLYNKFDKNLISKIKSIESDSILVANKIYENLSKNTKKIKNISLVGESEKYKSKGDLKIEFLDKDIFISLKNYKKPRLNLNNSTFSSWLYNLLKSDDYKRFNNYNKIKNISSKYNEIKNKEKENGNKNYATVATEYMNNKGHYKQIRNFIITSFNKTYTKKNSKEINKNFIKQLGFSGAEQIYVSINNNNKTKIYSSEDNEKFKKFYKSINKDFRIRLQKIKNANSIKIKFISEKKELLKYNLSFKEDGKVVSWVNLSDIFGE